MLAKVSSEHDFPLDYRHDGDDDDGDGNVGDCISHDFFPMSNVVSLIFPLLLTNIGKNKSIVHLELFL